jgi:hypothetical protein
MKKMKMVSNEIQIMRQKVMAAEDQRVFDAMDAALDSTCSSCGKNFNKSENDCCVAERILRK